MSGALSLSEKLAWLQANTCAFYIEVNDHRTVYEPTEAALSAAEAEGFLEPAAKAACLARDQIVAVQCYPHTPIGFHKVVAADIESAVSRMYEIVAFVAKEER